MGSAVQMNVRIDSALKERGDRILAKRGMTPSQAIRAFYTSITGTKKQSEEVFEAISVSGPKEIDESEKERKLRSIRAVQKSIREMNERFGVKDPSVGLTGLSDNELLEEALAERYLNEDVYL